MHFCRLFVQLWYIAWVNRFDQFSSPTWRVRLLWKCPSDALAMRSLAAFWLSDNRWGIHLACLPLRQLQLVSEDIVASPVHAAITRMQLVVSSTCSSWFGSEPQGSPWWDSCHSSSRKCHIPLGQTFWRNDEWCWDWGHSCHGFGAFLDVLQWQTCLELEPVEVQQLCWLIVIHFYVSTQFLGDLRSLVQFGSFWIGVSKSNHLWAAFTKRMCTAVSCSRWGSI